MIARSPKQTVALVLTAGLCLWFVSVAQAHRISGHPKTLGGKLRQARLQVWHDRQQLHESVEARHWLGRDLAYVARLRRLLWTSPFPSWWLRSALCVHGGEGSWSANTGNGFYGGMQFDYSTWRANGGLRFAPLAHLASPTEQLLVAYWTWRRRGWYPWPNTARACGLL